MLLNSEEIAAMGFGSVGERVLIDSRAAFFGASNIFLGDDCRIDCFAVISAGPGDIRLGRNVHVGAGAQIFGSGGVTVDDFAGLSGAVALYSASDDFTGGYLTNPTVPEDLRNVDTAPIHLGKHSVIGARSVVLPGVRLGVGSAVGALSLVDRDVPDYDVMTGNPLRRVAKRNKERISALETEFFDRQRSSGG